MEQRAQQHGGGKGRYNRTDSDVLLDKSAQTIGWRECRATRGDQGDSSQGQKPPDRTLDGVLATGNWPGVVGEGRRHVGVA